MLGLTFAAGVLAPWHGARAAVGFVQSKSAQDVQNPLSVTFSNNVKAGNVIAVAVAWNDAVHNLTSITDNCGASGSNTYIILDNPATAATIPRRAAMAYAFIEKSGGCTISATLDGVIATDIIVHELAGVDPATPVDTHLINMFAPTNTGADAISGAMIMAQDAEYVFAFAVGSSTDDTLSAGTGYTAREYMHNSGPTMLSADRVRTSAGQTGITFGVDDSGDVYLVGAMTFLPAGGVQVSSRSDTLSDSRMSATSNHTITFTPRTQVTGSSTITLAFPQGFTLPVDCGDIDAATSSQFNFNYPSCLPTVTAWGAYVAPGGASNFVQGNANNVSAATNQFTLSFNNNVGSGNLIVVAAFWNGTATALSVTDTLANVYSAVGPKKTGTGGLSSWNSQIFYAKNVTGGADNVTIKLSAAATSEIGLYIHEYTGMDPYAPLDATSVKAASSGNGGSGAATTRYTNELIFGFGLMGSSAYGAGDGFAQRSSFLNNITEDRIVNGIGTYEATVKEVCDYITYMATFKLVSPGRMLVLAAPQDAASTVHVATGVPITVKIGTNATQQQNGVHQIQNPSTPGTYTVSVGGTFGGSGNIPVSINAGFEVAATVAESLSLTVSGAGSGSFPTTGILDDFNRADENPLDNGNWSGKVYSPSSGQVNLWSYQAAADTSSSDSYWSSSTFGPDTEVYVTVAVKPFNPKCIAVICKIANPNSANFNAYWGEVCISAGTDSWAIYKFANNANELLSMSGSDVELNADDSIGMECVPGSQKLKRKSGGVWTDVKASTDTSYDNVSGYIGLHMEDVQGRADNFGGGTLVPACTADDGATVSQIATTGTSVPFGFVSPDTFYQGCQDLTVSTNAPGGYSLSVQESYAMRTASGQYSIPDTTCDAGTCTPVVAASWLDPNKNGFGHTCWNVSGSDCNASFANGTKFKPLAQNSGGSFPTTGILDNFNRANEDPLGNGHWSGPVISGASQLRIVSSAATNTASGGGSDSYWSAANFGPDVEVYVTLATKPGNGLCTTLLLRGNNLNSSSFNGYWCEHCADAGTDTFVIYRFDNNTPTNIASGSQELNSGDSIGASAIGSNLNFYYKTGAGAWTEKLSVNDPTYAGAGRIGLHMEDIPSRSDDFGGGTVGTGQALMSSSTPALATGRVKYRLSAPSSLPAGTYSTLITYTILATF